jgi:hypothetical protein
MSNDNSKAKENVKVCNRSHNPGDDWDDDGCCQSTKAKNEQHDEVVVIGAPKPEKLQLKS